MDNLANVAMDLGATPFQALTKVIIPMLKPGILQECFLHLPCHLTILFVSYFVTGNGVSTFQLLFTI